MRKRYCAQLYSTRHPPSNLIETFLLLAIIASLTRKRHDSQKKGNDVECVCVCVCVTVGRWVPSGSVDPNQVRSLVERCKSAATVEKGWSA